MPKNHPAAAAAPVSETQLSKRLHKYLVELQAFDTPRGIQQRNDLTLYLETLLCQWSQTLPIPSSTDTTNNPPFILPKVLSFGSTRLGVQRPDADLDLVVLSPRHVSRTHFFDSFPTFLEQLQNQQQQQTDSTTNCPRISDIHPVPTAYTPILKFRMNSIPVDLLFVQIMTLPDVFHIQSLHNTTSSNDSSDPSMIDPNEIDTMKLFQIPDGSSSKLFTLDDSILMGLDEASVRSINGVRVAELILELIPNRHTFCQSLRTIKEWAFVHGLYSNVLGFLGGIQWAILVAYICKHNPTAKPPTVLQLFFSVFSKWRWPRPVTLCPINTTPPPNVSPLGVWDPQTNPKDAMHLMPIITPAYPSMNSSYNIGMSQMRRLTHEFNRADRIIKGIVSGEHHWDHLFLSNDFFRQHVHFLQVDIISSTVDDHRAWFGFCESRLRLLINGLEAPECGVQCFPFAKFYHNNTAQQLKSENLVPDTNLKREEWIGTAAPIVFVSSFFVALRFAPMESIDLKQNTLEFACTVNNWEDRKEGMDLVIRHVLHKDLPSYVHESESRQCSATSLSSPPMKRAKRQIS